MPAVYCRSARWVAVVVAFVVSLCGWHDSNAVRIALGDEAGGNRLTYLDEFLDPYYVGTGFPKLTTPQWVGEPGVEAVVVLAIDDMRQPERYEAFLRPILDRLKAIDGRAPVSIMTCTVDPQDPQLAKWLAEGLSLEVHTITHPCPCLQNGDFLAAKRTYEQCVDLMSSIAGNRPVAFRMPCCDSRNTPSPRFWAEIFNRTTEKGNFLSIDSSVFQIFTPADPELPRELVLLPDGQERFRRYTPFPSFVNTIENYPYPYLIGRLCWQFPCMVPSDWEAQNVQRPNNPDTVRDWKIALDLVVRKQGVFNLVFHPHGWIRNDQIVELIDYAVAQHGGRVKFLTFREAHDRIQQHMLAGQPLRRSDGGDNGIRLLDVNGDGWMDVVIANHQVQKTRVWQPKENRWQDGPFPVPLIRTLESGALVDAGLRFGIVAGQVVALIRTPQESSAWEFAGGQWREAPRLSAGLPKTDLFTAVDGRDQGVRLRDLDGDGTCELLIANPRRREVWQYAGEQWKLLFTIAQPVSFVDDQGRDAGLRLRDLDGDGLDDLVFSNLERYGVYLLRRDEQGRLAGWTKVAQEALRGQGQDEGIPLIVRGGTNNGAWFHSRHLWVQNEDTSRLPDNVDRRSYAVLLGQQANMPPPRSAIDSLRSIHVHPLCRVELVACEPLVVDPIAFDWALDGSLYLVEMGDYPNGLESGPQGRIKRLYDDNRDGLYDRAVTVVDQLLFPTAVKTWRDGILVLCPPELFYAEDRDGDGRADTRQALFRGFAPGNPQHRANGLRWGMDGWLYIANGDSGGTIESVKTGHSVSISGRDVRIRPDTGEIEPVEGQTQYGRNRDDWDDWFGGNNANPLWHYVLPERYVRRNPYWPAANPRRDVPELPGAAPVFPRSFTLARFNDFNMANRFTSACSPEVYRDRLLGDEFAGNAFVCEPVHNLVHRLVLQPDGVTFRGRRAPEEQQSEFLASEDNWFRPVMVRTGPDGALWIADMYRLVIEHPEWIPRAWQEKLDLRAGADRGRIYRVIPAKGEPPRVPSLTGLSIPDWVRLLDHDNGWLRDMAQQKLLWEQATEAAELLAALVRTSTRPATRAQALATLDGLNTLPEPLLLDALRDAHPQVRRIAVRLIAQRLPQAPHLADRLEHLAVDESDVTVLWEVVFALGEAPRPSKLLKIVGRLPADRLVQSAFASSLRAENISAVAEELLNYRDERSNLPPLIWASPVIRFLAATHQEEWLYRLFDRWASIETVEASYRRQQWQLLAELLEQWPAESRRKAAEPTQRRIEALLEQAQHVALAPDSPAEMRAVAGRLLALAAWNPRQAATLLGAMLSPNHPPEVQAAAIDNLARFHQREIAELLLQQWRSYTPAMRARVLDVLLSRAEWIEQLLDHIEQGRIAKSELGPTQRQQLLTHRVESLRQRAARLWAESAPSDRQTVLERYQVVKSLTSDIAQGRVLFTKHCASCHQVDGQGHAVGPDLAALTDRSVDALLVAVLDPNRAVEDKFREYVAVLQDGRQFRGLLTTESTNSITLLAQEGKRIDILRSELEALVSTGKSLMPEGVENDISPQALAHIVAFVQSIEQPPKQFAGNSPRVAHVRDDGSIHLLATDCRIYGPTIVFEELYRNLGYWGSTDDRAVWDVDVPQEGTYRVVLNYACHDDSAGNRFRIEVAGQALGGTVEGTGTWDRYRHKDVGKVALPKGRLELTVRAEAPLHGYLMDLRQIVLEPE